MPTQNKNKIIVDDDIKKDLEQLRKEQSLRSTNELLRDMIEMYARRKKAQQLKFTK